MVVDAFLFVSSMLIDPLVSHWINCVICSSCVPVRTLIRAEHRERRSSWALEWFREFRSVGEITMIINDRVSADPDILAKVLQDAIAQVAGEKRLTFEIQNLEAFRPAPRNPIHRFQKPVAR